LAQTFVVSLSKTQSSNLKEEQLMNQANLQDELNEAQVEESNNTIALTAEELQFVGGGECVVNSI
jgi:hypothetical protein